MKMDMKDRLAGIMAVVDDHPVTAFIKAPFRGDGLGDKEQMPNELTIRDNETVNIVNVFFRHDERMDRRLGIDVLKSDRVLIFVDDRGGNLFLDDLAKQAVRSRTHYIFPCALSAKLRKKQDRSPV
jgi:hypothetical protein